MRCLFLVHHVEAIDALVDVYRAMRASVDFEPVVLSLPHRFPGAGGYGSEDAAHRALDDLGIEHLRFHLRDDEAGAGIIRLMAPLFLFRQSPWDGDIQPGLSFGKLAFTKLCYIPYAYHIIERYNTAPAAEPVATGSYGGFLRSCWRIFCETVHSRATFAPFVEHRSTLCVTGSPKFDRIAAASRGAPAWPIPIGAAPRPYRILWAPHHSIGEEWLGFGVFVGLVGDMINWMMADPTIEIVLKPHPALFDRLRGIGAGQLVDQFLDVWARLPNAAIVQGGQYGALFAGSDAMITDGISFLVEYQLADKPLIFVDSGRHVPFNAAGNETLASVYTVTTFAGLRERVETLRRDAGPDALALPRKRFVQEHLRADGHSATRILDGLRQSLAR